MSNPLGTREPLHSELPQKDIHDILSTLQVMDLNPEHYFVIGGANLVLRGIKPTTPDIDALVSGELFRELASDQRTRMKQPPAMARYAGANNATVWIESSELAVPFSATTRLGDGYYPMSFEDHKSRTELVQGVPCSLLRCVYEAKKALQRPSDILDIPRIELHLRFDIDNDEPF